MEDQETKKIEPEPYLFYNVMPKNGGSGEVVAPKVAVATPIAAQGPEISSSSLGFFAKYKKAIIWGVVGIIILIIGYLAYAHFVLNVPVDDTPVAIHQATTTPANQDNPQGTSTTPSDWQTKYFGSQTCQSISVCGDEADPDRDGLGNLQEFNGGTDPNHADSDNDGLADGDETNVFSTNPLTNHSGINVKYSDADNLKGGYNFTNDKPYSTSEIQSIIQNITKFGLHQPTLTTLGDAAVKIYKFDGSTTTPTSTSTTTASTTLPSNLDQSAQAKQDRDAQRSNTIQVIATALLKYQGVNKTFPSTNNFTSMYAEIKPYNIVATNPADPINIEPFIYSYSASSTDFTLSFYSETQSQLIKIHLADAQKYVSHQAAANNDEERKTDLDSLQSALLLYSNNNTAGNQDYVFPTQSKYKTALVPQYISAIPLDPQTQKDYNYEVSATFDTFTLKAVLQNPPTGSTGYMCNQLECSYY